MMDIATYRTAIEAWILAQTGITAQWRDSQGGWQGKAQIRLHLHSSGSYGVDHIRYTTTGKIRAFRLTVSSALPLTAYTVTVDGTAIPYTSDSDTTVTEIRDGLKALIDVLDVTTSSVGAAALDVVFDDPIGETVTVGANLALSNSLEGDAGVTICGDRALVLSIMVKSRDQSPTKTAMWYLEKIRTSLGKPSVLSALKTAGLAFARAENVQDLDGWLDDRIESVGVLDIHLNAVVNESDDDHTESGSFVETVEIAAELLDPLENDLGWDSESFGD